MLRQIAQFAAIAVIAVGLSGQSAAEERLNVLGSEIVIKADGGSSAGAVAVIESFVQPGGGPPLHVHGGEDELFYVLEGQFKIWRGDEVLEVGPGAVAYLPRNVPHTYKNVGSQPGRLLATITPAGFEGFFREASKRGLMPPKDMQEVIALGKEYDLQFLGPPPTN